MAVEGARQASTDVRPMDMASMDILGSVQIAKTFLDDSKKRKKKKAKKLRKEKLDKQRSKPKAKQSLKDYTDVCDSNLSPQWPDMKKKKRKKKPEVRLNEKFSLTQNKNAKLSKRHKQNRKSCCALDTNTVEYGVQSSPGEQEMVLSTIQKEKKDKKRVMFNLPPMLLESKPFQNPFAVRDIPPTQFSVSDKKLSYNMVFPPDGQYSKPVVEEKGNGSQSTSDDINSQDLFITQKSFTNPYIDLCSSTSAEETLEPQRCTASCPEHHSLPKKPAYHPSPPTKTSHYSIIDASTQTENFFTSPFLAASLRFHYSSTCTEEPIDLSLPKRSRLNLREAVSEDRRHCELTATDLMQSDDSDSHVKSKADMSQLKVVQTRLNESFFFRLKGDGDSPKPMSPLMKFTGSVEKKKV